MRSTPRDFRFSSRQLMVAIAGLACVLAAVKTFPAAAWRDQFAVMLCLLTLALGAVACWIASDAFRIALSDRRDPQSRRTGRKRAKSELDR